MHRFVCLVLIAGLVGCVGPKPSSPARMAPEKRLAYAENLYQQKDLTAAMIECVELARHAPLTPGLAELQARIMAALTEERARVTTLRSRATTRRMDTDIEKHNTVPDTYGLRRSVRGLTSPMRTPPSRMQQVLDKKVSVHLDGVTLSDFIMAIGAAENVNIIADDALSGANTETPPTLTLHADDVPLSEVLDYVSRNLGVNLFVGENILWVTPGAQTGSPMETRMYRLRKGLSSEELADSSGKIKIIEAIERFVPAEANADILFDKKSHVLIVRNTLKNLARIEDLIETLDVCPPQILIEARFISTNISDLRELGVDWILNSPLMVTKKRMYQDGERVWANKTQVNPTAPEAIVGFSPFPNVAQGLNFSYQGILTDPMFQAVLHALDTSGKSRTLSVPKVTTVNNLPAQMRIGEDFRYFEQYDVQSVPSSVTDAGSQVYSTILVPVGTPSLEELGIQLDVTPSVGADLATVTLRIVPEISEFVRWEHYEVASGSSANSTTASGTTTNGTSLVKLPIFRRSKIETELIIQSAETVVMGGLISSAETKTRSGVPILSSIPLLGRLFRHDSIEATKQNLLIFVTATILSERGETLIPMVGETGSPAGT